MTIDEFIEAARTRPVTDETIKAFTERREARAKEDEEWDRAQRHFDYNRRYTI